MNILQGNFWRMTPMCYMFRHSDILNIKETVEGNTRKIQDITKLMNIHKSDIWSELMESFNQSRYHLDQTVAHMANPWG